MIAESAISGESDEPHQRLESRLGSNRLEGRTLLHLREFDRAVLIRAFERRERRRFLTERIVDQRHAERRHASVAVGPDGALYVSNRGTNVGTGQVIRFEPPPQ